MGVESHEQLDAPIHGVVVKHEFAEKEKRPLLVCDIGGTTTDVGMLLASGLPRQAAAITDVSGVMMNFSCPDVKR